MSTFCVLSSDHRKPKEGTRVICEAWRTVADLCCPKTKLKLYTLKIARNKSQKKEKTNCWDHRDALWLLRTLFWDFCRQNMMNWSMITRFSGLIYLHTDQQSRAQAATTIDNFVAVTNLTSYYLLYKSKCSEEQYVLSTQHFGSIFGGVVGDMQDFRLLFAYLLRIFLFVGSRSIFLHILLYFSLPHLQPGPQLRAF